MDSGGRRSLHGGAKWQDCARGRLSAAGGEVNSEGGSAAVSIRERKQKYPTLKPTKGRGRLRRLAERTAGLEADIVTHPLQLLVAEFAEPRHSLIDQRTLPDDRCEGLG